MLAKAQKYQLKNVERKKCYIYYTFTNFGKMANSWQANKVGKDDKSWQKMTKVGKRWQ